MEAKEKALELVEKFWCEVEDLNVKGFKMSKNQAIQFALICVDEIIKELNLWGAPYLFEESSENDWAYNRMNTYWQSVKQELLNLK